MIKISFSLSYYFFNTKQLSQKGTYKYNCGGKDKAAKYYIQNKVVLK